MNDTIKLRGLLCVIWIVCLGLLFLASPQTAPPVRAQSQNEMNMSAARDFARADARLTRVYKQILSRDLESATRRKMIASEKAWIVYRDSQGHFEASAAAEGGSMYPLIFNGTRARLTEERIKELKRAMESP